MTTPHGPLGLPLCFSHAAVVAARLNDAMRSPVSTDEPPPRQGYVYFIRFRDRIKIGHTTDVRTRLGAIPHDQVLAVMRGSRLDERRCHAAFADLRVQGEWFRADPRLLEFIGRLQEDDTWTSLSSQQAG